MPHTLNIFLQGFEKGSFYISNPTHCENREVVGGISPPWLKSFKNGGEFTPGGDITPLSFLSNLRRGGYHHLFRKLCKMGGISHLGGISPPCPYMASVNGCRQTGLVRLEIHCHRLEPPPVYYQRSQSCPLHCFMGG